MKNFIKNVKNGELASPLSYVICAALPTFLAFDPTGKYPWWVHLIVVAVVSLCAFAWWYFWDSAFVFEYPRATREIRLQDEINRLKKELNDDQLFGRHFHCEKREEELIKANNISLEKYRAALACQEALKAEMQAMAIRHQEELARPRRKRPMGSSSSVWNSWTIRETVDPPGSKK